MEIETLFEFENKSVLIIVDDFGKVWFKGSANHAKRSTIDTNIWNFEQSVAACQSANQEPRQKQHVCHYRQEKA